jgi:hypothetical protein
MGFRFEAGKWWSYAHYSPDGLVAYGLPPEKICDGSIGEWARTTDGAWEVHWCFKCKRVGAQFRPVVRTKQAHNYFRAARIEDWPPEAWAILKAAGIERKNVELPSRNNGA